MRWSLRRDERARETKLVGDLIAAAIYVGAVLMVLMSVLVLPFGGLIATSGIVAIVFGLALQNTLADVFAGIAVGIENPFRVGDRISLGTSFEVSTSTIAVTSRRRSGTPDLQDPC